MLRQIAFVQRATVLPTSRDRDGPRGHPVERLAKKSASQMIDTVNILHDADTVHYRKSAMRVTAGG